MLPEWRCAGNQYQFDKIFRKQLPETEHTRSQHFSHTDFLDTLLCRERCQAKKSQAGNEDRDHGDDGSKVTDEFFVIEFLRIFNISKSIYKREGRIVPVKYWLNPFDRSGCGNIWIHPDIHRSEPALSEYKCHG